jgi:hypothetical protein
MKKLSIQNLSICVNNEKINITYLENKSEKYILYSAIDEHNIDSNTFSKMEFPVNIQITPKKKMNDLRLNVQFNKSTNLFTLLLNNNPLYFIKNSKNIIANNPKLKLILQNGKLYTPQEKEIITPVKDIVNEILSKNKKNDSEESHEIKNIDVNTENESEFNIKKISNITEEKKNNLDLHKENVGVSEEKSSNQIIVDEEESSDESEEEVVSNNEIVEEVVSNNEIVEEVVSNNEIVEEVVSNNEIVEEVVSNNENVEDNSLYNPVLKEKKVHFENIEEEKYIDKNTNIINNYNKDTTISQSLNNKKIELEKEVFNLENILVDFNKLFQFIKKDNQDEDNKSVNKLEENKVEEKKIIINTTAQERITNIKNVNNTNKITNIQKNEKNEKKDIIKPINKEIIIPEKEYKFFSLKINYQNIFYKINAIKLDQSPDLNMLNLYKHEVPETNFINKTNLSFQLENNNSSYLIIFMNQKILLNKINNNIVFTNLINKNSQILKNKDNFKIGNYDFLIYNECTLIIPVTNQKIFDNNYGTSYNLYIPKT